MAVGFSRNFFQAVFSNDSEVAPGFGETRVSSNSTFFGQNLDAFCSGRCGSWAGTVTLLVQRD